MIKTESSRQGGGAATQRFAKPSHTGSNPVLASSEDYRGLRSFSGTWPASIS